MYKLLICDDEPLERAALRKVIGHKYPNIAILDDAKTGGEAIESVKQNFPDILLIDIKMPEINGLEAQKKIIEFHPSIKTVIITAYSDFSYAHEAIKYNISAFLLKPVPPAEIYTCFNKLLAQLDAELGRFVKNEHRKDSTPAQQALTFINSHLTERLRISDVAEHVNLSEKYFSRYFKEQTGMTFTHYIHHLLIKKAKGLLVHTSEPIYKIAMDLGFSDSAYFTKTFRSYQNITPLKFRQMYKKI